MIEEDSNDIPILEENRDPIPVPPPHIGNTENIEIVEMASQVSRQRCIRPLGQISRQTPCLGTIGTEHLCNNLSRRCCVARPSSLHTESNIRILWEAREDSPSDGVTNRTLSSDVAGGSSLSPESLRDVCEAGENIGRDRRGVREEVGKSSGSSGLLRSSR